MSAMLGIQIKLDGVTATKLNLYASLSHQTAEQAAQEIVKHWLETAGEERIAQRVSQHVENINTLSDLMNHSLLSKRTPAGTVQKTS